MGAGKRSDRKVTYLDLKLKGQDTKGNDLIMAWFTQTEGKGESRRVVDQFDFIEGYIVKLEPIEFKYDLRGKEKTGRKFKIYFYDKGEKRMYEVTFGYTTLWRSIINSLYGAKEPFKKIRIEVYVYNDFPGGKVYNGGPPYNKDNELRWGVSWEGQKKYIRSFINKDGDPENDYSELDERLKSIALNEITEKIGSSYNIAELLQDFGVEEADNRSKQYTDPGTIHVNDIENPDEFKENPLDDTDHLPKKENGDPGPNFQDEGEESAEDDLPF